MTLIGSAASPAGWSPRAFSRLWVFDSEPGFAPLSSEAGVGLVALLDRLLAKVGVSERLEEESVDSSRVTLRLLMY